MVAVNMKGCKVASKEKIGVGVIGVGWFGELHARIYASMPQAHLVGVCDENQARAEEVAQNIGVRVYQRIDDLLSDPEIQAVSISTSDHQHVEPALKACAAGKHVLVEKPMAMSLVDCDRIKNAADKAGVQLMPGHLLHFNNTVKNAFHKIRNGEIGEVSHIFSHRSLPKSAAHRVAHWDNYHAILFHLAVHDIDMISWLAGDQIEEVYAQYRHGTIESEGSKLTDAVLSLLRFKGGALAIMEHSWIHPNNYPILVEAATTVTGTKGKIVIDLEGRGAIRFSDKGVHHFQETYWPIFFDQLSSDLKNELEVFVSSIANQQPLPITPDEGKRSIAVALAMQQSFETHLPVKVAS